MRAHATAVRWLGAHPAASACLLFAFALGVRLLYLWEWHDHPFFHTLIGDGLRYHQWAQEIAAGDWMGREVFFQAPLYPYFLGTLYTLFGDGPGVARVAQAVLGAASCVLFWHFARRAFSPAVGALCGLGLALYAPAIFNDGVVQKTALTGALFTATLYLYALLAYPPHTTRRAGVGIVLGITLALLALAQEHLLLLTPLLAAFLLLRPAPNYRQRLLPVLGLALGLALVFTPIGVRNHSIGGTFLITTSQFGTNFYLGNNPRADGHYHPLREGRGDAEFERHDAAQLASQARGRRLNPSEVSHYWLDQSIAFIRQQPAAWLALSAHKWHLVWHQRELPDTDSLAAYADQSRVLAFLFAGWNFAVLAALAAAGVALRWRQWKTDAWMLASLLAISLAVAVFIVYARYRFPLVYLLMPFAAHAVIAAIAWLRHAWSRTEPAPPAQSRTQTVVTVGMAAGALVVAAAVVNWPLPERDLRAINYYSVAARILDQHGSLEQAEQLLERTIALAPTEAYPHFALSVIYKRRGDYAREVAALRTALGLAPGVRDGYRALAEAERRAGLQRARPSGRADSE